MHVVIGMGLQSLAVCYLQVIDTSERIPRLNAACIKRSRRADSTRRSRVVPSHQSRLIRLNALNWALETIAVDHPLDSTALDSIRRSMLLGLDSTALAGCVLPAPRGSLRLLRGHVPGCRSVLTASYQRVSSVSPMRPCAPTATHWQSNILAVALKVKTRSSCGLAGAGGCARLGLY
jgi:hypothetical protein